MVRSFIDWGFWCGLATTCFLVLLDIFSPTSRHAAATLPLLSACAAVALFCLAARAAHARAQERSTWFGALIVSIDHRPDGSIYGYVVDVVALRAIDQSTALARAEELAEARASILNQSRQPEDPEQQYLYADVWRCDPGDIDDGSEVWSIGMKTTESPEQFLRRFQRPGEELG